MFEASQQLDLRFRQMLLVPLNEFFSYWLKNFGGDRVVINQCG
jgi:hypothetical protein